MYTSKVYKSESVDSCVCRHLFRVALCKCPGWIYIMVDEHKMAVAVKVCSYTAVQEYSQGGQEEGGVTQSVPLH